jgi:hypothetical protein
MLYAGPRKFADERAPTVVASTGSSGKIHDDWSTTEPRERWDIRSGIENGRDLSRAMSVTVKGFLRSWPLGSPGRSPGPSRSSGRTDLAASHARRGVDDTYRRGGRGWGVGETKGEEGGGVVEVEQKMRGIEREENWNGTLYNVTSSSVGTAPTVRRRADEWRGKEFAKAVDGDCGGGGVVGSVAEKGSKRKVSGP